MDLQTIKALIAAMADSGLAEMSYAAEGWSLTLRRGASASDSLPGTATASTSTFALPVAGRASAPVEEDEGVCRAPLSGVLHLQPSPGAAPFIRLGQHVREGEMLCLIEAMKVFNPVRAERAGKVAEVLAADGTEVEAGQAIMRIVVE